MDRNWPGGDVHDAVSGLVWREFRPAARGGTRRRSQRSRHRRILERMVRRHVRARGEGKEIRDRVAAELVVPVVPRHEPRHLGQRRRAGNAQGSFHSGLCRPGQPARRIAALRTLGLARHHHLRTRRHGDREAARLLLAQVPDPDPRRDDQGSLAGRLRQVRRPREGAHSLDRTDRGAKKRDPGLPRQGLRPRQRRLEQEQAGRRADLELVPRSLESGRQGGRRAHPAHAHRADRPDRQEVRRHQPGQPQAGLVEALDGIRDVRRSRRRSPPMHAPRYNSTMRRIVPRPTAYMAS